MSEAPRAEWGMRGRGRVARLVTNETCNQGCAFCHRRRPAERRDFIAPRALTARIRETASAGVVVITGGEPTLRRDLASIVEAVRAVRTREGPVRVELETNGTLLTPERAVALKRAGLELVRVHMPAWGEEADALSRDPGGFAETLSGLEAALDAGLRVELSAPVLRVNRASLPALPAQVARHLEGRDPGVEALVLNVPVESPSPSTLCRSEEAARCIERVDVAARRVGIPLRLDGATPLAPCFFSRPNRVARLFALSAGGRERAGYTQRAACRTCMVRDRCPGVNERERAPELTPIREDRVRRRLSVISSVPDQVRRELYQDEVHRPPGSPPRRVRTVRLAFACNQACDFCFVSTHLPAAEPSEIERALREAAERGDDINLSGGEPTLLPDLERWVTLARDAGAGAIEIQTNATRIDEDRARALSEAGADVLFVSLHGASAAVSDAVTQAPGTFVETLRGIEAATRVGLRLRVNFVFCQTNVEDFPAFVRLMADRFAGAELCVSFVAPSTDMVPRTRALIPRYTDIQPALREGLRIARDRGLRVSGFDAMCGLPLCLTPPEALDASLIADAPPDYDGGEMVRGPACAECGASQKCFGLRQGYAELYGTDELRPLPFG